MDAIRDDELTWLGIAGHVLVIYIVLVFANVVSGDPFSLYVLGHALGFLFNACFIAGVLCALLRLAKFKYVKASFYVLTIVVLVISKIGAQDRSGTDQKNNFASAAKISELRGKTSADEQLKILAIAHPDFAEIASSKRFLSWIAKQPQRVQKLYSSQNADDNIILLDLYKAEVFRQDAARKEFVQKIREESETRN